MRRIGRTPSPPTPPQYVGPKASLIDSSCAVSIGCYGTPIHVMASQMDGLAWPANWNAIAFIGNDITWIEKFTLFWRGPCCWGNNPTGDSSVVGKHSHSKAVVTIFKIDEFCCCERLRSKNVVVERYSGDLSQKGRMLGSLIVCKSSQTVESVRCWRRAKYNRDQ